MKKNKFKKDILAQFINDAKDKNFSDKLEYYDVEQKVLEHLPLLSNGQIEQ